MKEKIYTNYKQFNNFQITDALNSLGHDKRTVSSVKNLWDDLLKTAKKEISSTAKISTGVGPANILSGMNQKILAVYGEDSPILLGLEGVETNDIEVVLDIEISAVIIMIDATNSKMPNTVTVD